MNTKELEKIKLLSFEPEFKNKSKNILGNLMICAEQAGGSIMVEINKLTNIISKQTNNPHFNCKTDDKMNFDMNQNIEALYNKRFDEVYISLKTAKQFKQALEETIDLFESGVDYNTLSTQENENHLTNMLGAAKYCKLYENTTRASLCATPLDRSF